MLGLRFCARAFSSCSERGPLFIAVHGPLTVTASLVAEHKLQTHRLSSCGPRAQLLRGMWNPPRPGLKPMSPASAGRLSTTAPPGKPCMCFLDRRQGDCDQNQSRALGKYGSRQKHFVSQGVYVGTACGRWGERWASPWVLG